LGIPMSGTRLAIVILGVADIPRALGFCRSVFGWTLEVETPVYVEFSLPDDMRLGLYQRDAFARNVNEAIHAIPAEALAPTELYLFPDDLEATAVRLHVAGARPLSSLPAIGATRPLISPTPTATSWHWLDGRLREAAKQAAERSGARVVSSQL